MLFLYYVLFFVIFVYYFTKTRKALHMLQQNLYDENHRYGKWMLSNLKTCFWYGDLLGIPLTLLLFFFHQEMIVNILLFIMIGFYLFIEYSFLIIRKNEQNKKPLVVTKRIQRLIITLTILYILPIVLAFFGLLSNRVVLLFLVSFAVFAFLLTYLALFINHPIERAVFHYFRHKAKKKLASMSHLKVIGITGSYGKTSSKNILNDILNVKYITRPTPKNFNTENGLMITINNYLDKFDDIFIAEMGAYTRGDIQKLCDLVHPQYGILTTIGTAHLSSFGSEENIQKTKFELIESLPEDGVAVLNRDDPKQVSYPLKNKVKIIWIGIDHKDCDVRAENIQCSSEGTTFDLVLESGTYPFETKLLGSFNVYNILAAIALGLEFGITIPELQSAVRRVKSVEHRLELKRLGDMYQIDDAYNSNPVGAKMALDVLKMMPGTRVVVTPGMTELGSKEFEYNRLFGTQMKDACDYVILVGKKQTEAIYQGLQEVGFPMDHVEVIQDVRDSYAMVLAKKSSKKDIYALYENDLPDALITKE